MAESNSLDISSRGSTEVELVFTSKKFKQILKKKGKFQHYSRKKDNIFKKKYKEENNEIIYFQCTKARHMKVECPKLKKRYSGDKQKKSLMVTWDDLD